MKRAIGYIRLDISGSRVDADKSALERYAAAQGLDLVRILEMPETVIDNTLRLLEAAHLAHAHVVIAPTFAHVDSARRAITEQFELRTVEFGSTWKRGHRWQRQIMPEGVMMHGADVWPGA